MKYVERRSKTKVEKDGREREKRRKGAAVLKE